MYVCHGTLRDARYCRAQYARTEQSPTPFNPFSDFALYRATDLSPVLYRLQYVWHIVIYEPTSAQVAAGNDDIKCSD